MKKLFLFAAAALTLAACSNDETVEVNQGDAINFRPLVTNVTRAADAHFNVSGDQFKVTAYLTGTTTAYFTDVVFQGDGSTFTSTTNKYYWPSSTNLDFWAFAPVTNGQVSYTAGDVKTFTVTPSETASEQVDLVYARTNDWGKATSAVSGHQITSSVTGVTINFRHAESKVAIQLKNSNPNLTFTIGNVTIGNLQGTGSFTFAETTTDTKDATNIAGGWTSSAPITTAYSQDLASAYTATSSAVQQGVDMILIPQTLTKQSVYGAAAKYISDTDTPNSIFKGPYISVTLKIQNAAGSTEYIVGGASNYVTAIWPIETITWTPGNKYIYTVDLAGGGYYPTNQDDSEDLDPILEGAEIKFVTVTVDGWDNVTPTDITGPAL